MKNLSIDRFFICFFRKNIYNSIRFHYSTIIGGYVETTLKSLSGSVLFFEEQLRGILTHLNTSIDKKNKNIPLSSDSVEFASKLGISKKIIEELIVEVEKFRNACDQDINELNLQDILKKSKYTIDAFTTISRFLLLHTLSVLTALNRNTLNQSSLQIVLLQTELLRQSWNSFVKV